MTKTTPALIPLAEGADNHPSPSELLTEIEHVYTDAERYRYLRSRPEDTIGKGGIFAGMTPPDGYGGYILTGEHLDRAIDRARAEEDAGATP